MANYGQPDYSMTGGKRLAAERLRRSVSSANQLATALAGGNSAGSLTNDTKLALLEDGELATATIAEVGAIIGGGGGGSTWLWQEVNFGSVPAQAGRFVVTFSGATVGQLAQVVEYPVTLSNGELGDRCEMDSVDLVGHVLGSDQITVHWRSSGPVAGLRAVAFTAVNLA